jgi:hypothetical protein
LADELQKQRLPAGYSIEMDACSKLLVLCRAEGSVAKRFVFSSMSPTPQALRQAAQEDLALRGTTTNHYEHLPKGVNPPQEEEGSASREDS